MSAASFEGMPGQPGFIATFELYQINPISWTVGTATVGRKGGKIYATIVKDEGLRVYQQAVREEVRRLIVDNLPAPTWEPLTGALSVSFRFWRQLEQYQNAGGRTVTRHRADVTNMQKALEDALQYDKKTGFGVFVNDNQVVNIASEVVAQGTDVEPFIVIQVEVL